MGMLITFTSQSSPGAARLRVLCQWHICGCITCHGGAVPTYECAIGTGGHGTARMVRDSRVDARPEQLWVRQSCWRIATLLGQLSVWRAGGRLSMEMRWCCWCGGAAAVSFSVVLGSA